MFGVESFVEIIFIKNETANRIGKG